MKKRAFIVFIIFLLLFSSCARRNETSSSVSILNSSTTSSSNIISSSLSSSNSSVSISSVATTSSESFAIIKNDATGIPDKVLYKIILSALGKTGGEFTANEAFSLNFLNYYCNNNEKINDLTGIENLANLTRLSLTENNITDFTPILKLKNLKSLNLSNNKISDISAAYKLTYLDILNFSYNNITDISPLSSLTNLSELYLWYNNIEDISPLLPLKKLKALNLESNYINMSIPKNMDDINTLKGRIKYFALGLQGVKIGETHKFTKVNLYIDSQQTKTEDINIRYVSATLNNIEIELNKYHPVTIAKSYSLKMKDNLGTDYEISFKIVTP